MKAVEEGYSDEEILTMSKLLASPSILSASDSILKRSAGYDSFKMIFFLATGYRKALCLISLFSKKWRRSSVDTIFGSVFGLCAIISWTVDNHMHSGSTIQERDVEHWDKPMIKPMVEPVAHVQQCKEPIG